MTEFKNHHFEIPTVLTESGKGQQKDAKSLVKYDIHVFLKDNATYHLLITKGKQLYTQEICYLSNLESITVRHIM